MGNKNACLKKNAVSFCEAKVFSDRHWFIQITLRTEKQKAPKSSVLF